MLRSEQVNDLFTALSKAQGEIKPAIKDSNNPFFHSKYADLASVWEACREVLTRNGLLVSQHPSAEGNVVTVETILGHVSGQWISSCLTMTAKENTPQAIGSCLTYIRRYSLSAILGIASELDDDGNAASSAKNGNTYVPAPKTQPSPIQAPKTGIVAPPVIPKGKTISQSPDPTSQKMYELAEKLFATPDEFKVWRIDNSFVEHIKAATFTEREEVLEALEELWLEKTKA